MGDGGIDYTQSDDSDHHHRHDLAAKPRLQSGLKLCFVHAAANNYYSIDGGMGCHEILYKRSWFQEDGCYLTAYTEMTDISCTQS